MSLIHELEREYEEIRKTKFWAAYMNELMAARQLYESKLFKDDLTAMVSQGKGWQEIVKLLDNILVYPRRVFKNATLKKGD